MRTSESITKLTGALLKAKDGFDPLVKNQENPGFKRGGKIAKYADLEAVIDATEPSLRANGLVLLQFPHSEGRSVGVLSFLAHESGEFMEHAFAFPLTKEDAQTGAGAITYARRMGMKGILGLTDTDDDGNTATNNTGGNRAPVPAAKSAVKTTAPKAEAKPAGVPKSEIPNELPAKTVQPSTKESKASSAPTDLNESDNGALPSEAEMKGFRRQFIELQEKLGDAGLVPTKGNPLQKQALKYLLAVTGASKPEDITKVQWKIFFSTTDASLGSKESTELLIAAVNLANGEKK